MAALRLAKDCLAAQIATSLSTLADDHPTEFPNKIRPFRPSVRRRSRLAYALLSRSVDVNDGVKCFLPKMALEGVITDERLDAVVGQAGRRPQSPQKPDNFCACLRAAWVQN